MSYYPYQNSQYNMNFSQQPIEMKICQRARGPHTEGEIYCGRSLPLNYFSKGRAQCKECSAKKTQLYNENKITTMIHQQSNLSLNPLNKEMEDELKRVKTELSTLLETLKLTTSELEQMKIEHKKYYDGALEYYNETLALKKEIETLTSSNSVMIKKIDTIRLEFEEKTRNNLNTISSLQKENTALKSENLTLSNDIKSLNDEIRVLERKR